MANSSQWATAPPYRDSELVFGLVSPVGAKLDTFDNLLERNLDQYGYKLNKVRLSQLAANFHAPDQSPTPPTEREFDRLSRLMTLGNELRARRPDFLALAAAEFINSGRGSDRADVRPRVAHVVRSLKHPEEVLTLRRIYGSGFYLVGVIVEEDERRRYLRDEKNCSIDEADRLLKRDEHEADHPHGQRTRETFHLADVFVPLSSEEKLQRFLNVVFGYPFETPALDEYAMFLAFTSSLRSADLSRQVGAVVVSQHGDIVGVGANDVPRAQGGLYWPGPGDHRDHVKGVDFNEQEREKMVEDVLTRLRPSGFSEAEWLERGRLAFANLSLPTDELEKALRTLLPAGMTEPEWGSDGRVRLASSPLMDITEYGRAVHAEMEAILSCARSGVSPRGATLYSTTFPCHNCAKHIVASGILRVVYVEPYAKSRAMELFSDSISQRPQTERVSFEPFQGIGPRRFLDLFSLNLSSGYKTLRKSSGGRKLDWKPTAAYPRVPLLPNTYIDRERVAAQEIIELTSEPPEGQNEKDHPKPSG